jgi:hypothetical protein
MLRRTSGILLLCLLPGAAVQLGGCAAKAVEPAAPPGRLADTGLYADFAARRLADDVLSFTPQYPLWTDGATKERWIALPPGTAIDGSDPDHWVFPVGTRLWKEFRFGRAVETRFMQLRSDGSWLYATYEWRDDGSDALLAPAVGVRAACPTAEGSFHDLPAVEDCRLCHEGGRTPVLGFSALQLSPDRDPLAPHAEPPGPTDVDLPALVARGLLRDLPARWLEQAPRTSGRTPRERAVLGYLHGNCGNCHNGDGPLRRLGLRLDHPLGSAGEPPAVATTRGVASQFTRPDRATRVVAGQPDLSLLVHRIAATDPLTQMPPFGRHLTDRTALALVEDWVELDLASAAPVTTDHSMRKGQ